MKNQSKLTFAVVVVLSCIGCAGKYPVTFDSYPQGATLLCGGTNWGYTPKTLYYDKEVKKERYLSLRACSANWASGARENYGSVPVQQYPKGVRQTLQRPDVPGFQQDAEFALKVQQLNAQSQGSGASQSSNVVYCKKFGDLSGRLYQFDSFCPVGYFK